MIKIILIIIAALFAYNFLGIGVFMLGLWIYKEQWDEEYAAFVMIIWPIALIFMILFSAPRLMRKLWELIITGFILLTRRNKDE
jgi:hypothetical protein